MRSSEPELGTFTWDDKNDFSRRQATAPVLLAMGRADQRALVTSGAKRATA
jgi:hypothetical protein